MTISVAASDARIRAARIDDQRLTVDLVDGRTIAVPLAWFPRLARATPAQRARWEIAAAGRGLHWPELDEDLGVEGLLRGAAAPAR
jgi:hypothetical protein